MDALNDNQRLALIQLHELTNGGDDDTAINILESVGWDVQQAANLIFGGTVASAPSTSRLENCEIDDSNQGLPEPDVRPRARHAQPLASMLFLLARPIISLLAIPVHILANIVRFIFGLLRIPVPQFHLRFVGLNFNRSFPTVRSNNRTTDSGPERWIRELEEETGAVCVGRTRKAIPSRSDVASSALDAGPSNLTARSTGSRPSIDLMLEDGRKVLPDFVTGSYEEMLRICKKEARIGCVILVNQEHDDVPAFKRFTLTDPTFVKTLYDNDIAVWGGDVRDREAWSASEKLQATTYPFVAFLALQPRRSPSGSSSSHNNSSPTLTILSRHQGNPMPASGPTSAATLVSYLERQVLPRVVPFLDVLKVAERERQLERQLREEQDRAYRAAAQRDKERIEARMKREREAAEEKKRQEEDAKKEQEMRLLEDEYRRRKEEEKLVWWRWIRRKLSEENSTRADDGSLRVAIRLPNGSRPVRNFRSDASLTTLYAFVASQLIPGHIPEGRDPDTPPYGSSGGSMESCIESKMASSRCGAEKWWGFQVVNAYPRREIEWKASVKLGEVDCLKGGGQVVVEMLNSDKALVVSDEDDGYDTEE